MLPWPGPRQRDRPTRLSLPHHLHLRPASAAALQRYLAIRMARIVPGGMPPAGNPEHACCSSCYKHHDDFHSFMQAPLQIPSSRNSTLWAHTFLHCEAGMKSCTCTSRVGHWRRCLIETILPHALKNQKSQHIACVRAMCEQLQCACVPAIEQCASNFNVLVHLL